MTGQSKGDTFFPKYLVHDLHRLACGQQFGILCPSILEVRWNSDRLPLRQGRSPEFMTIHEAALAIR